MKLGQAIRQPITLSAYANGENVIIGLYDPDTGQPTEHYAMSFGAAVLLKSQIGDALRVIGKKRRAHASLVHYKERG